MNYPKLSTLTVSSIHIYSIYLYQRILLGFFSGEGEGVLLVFSFHWKKISLIWRRYHCRRRLQILTYTRHSGPLSNGVLWRTTPTVTQGHPFIMGISEDPGHSQLQAFGSGKLNKWNCQSIYFKATNTHGDTDRRTDDEWKEMRMVLNFLIFLLLEIC